MTSADTSGPGGALLGGVSVVELPGPGAQGIAGAFAAALLAELGATVTKVGMESNLETALAITLDRAKVRAAPGTDLEALVAGADIVIGEATDPGALAPVGVHAQGVRVSITPFGLDGPRSHERGGELVAQAAGGLLGTIEAADGTPTPAPGHLAAKAAGACAALAALHGFDRRQATGAPVHVDVSVQEAVVFCAALPECAHELYACEGKPGSGRYVAPSGVFPCRDGHVRITAVENHQWAGMCAALGHPQWTEGLEDRPVRAEHTDLIVREVGAWTAGQDKAVVADLLQRHRVPATPVNTPAELLSSPQLAHRGSVRSATVGGREVPVLGPPWRIAPGAEAVSERPSSLRGLRVAELTHVLAGPIVGALLGGMGATVVRLEDPARLDIYRRIGPFAHGIEGPERAAYFAVANHSKASVLLDADHIERDVADVIAASDVVIENVGAERLRRLSVRPSDLAEQGHLTLHVSGFGVDGPLASYRVYANNVQAYGGLASLTIGGDGAPARLGTVIADPLSSVVGALVISAWALGPERGRGAVADLSMAEVVAATVAELAVADPTTDASARRHVLPTADGRWVAYETADGDEQARVDAALTSSAGDADSVVDAITGVGVAAATVLRGPDLVTDPHLIARGFFPRVSHPDADLADARVVGLPWRFSGQGAVALGPPPALGSTPLRAVTGAAAGDAEPIRAQEAV